MATLPTRGRRSAVPFRRSLVVNLTLLAVVFGAAMLVLTLYSRGKAVEKLSASLTRRVMSATDAQLRGFFEPVQAVLEITAERWEDGEFVEWDLSLLDRYFQPLIENLPQVSSVMLATETGDEYMLLSTPDGWRSRHTRPSTWGEREEWREWKEDEAPIDEIREVAYDARTRPWFTGAMSRWKEKGPAGSLRDHIHWTEPYSFFTTREPGITASIAFRTEAGPLGIVAFDVLLTDISDYTTQLRIGEEGKVFVLRGDPVHPEGIVVIGLPFDPRFGDPSGYMEFILHPPSDLGGPVSDFVYQELGEEARIDGEPVRFVTEGRVWWGAAVRSALRTSDDIWVGAVIPETELLRGLPSAPVLVVIVTLAVVALAIVRSLRLARSYGGSVEALADSAARMQRLDFGPTDAVESHITELRQLGATLEGMRQALHSYSSVREDIRIARAIAESARPSPLPRPAGLELDAWCQTSHEVSGVVHDAVWVEGDERLALLACESSGVGVRAALDAVEVRIAFRSGIRQGLEPGELMEQLERCVAEDLVDGPRVCVWVGLLDRRAMVLRSCGRGYDGVRLLERPGYEPVAIGAPGDPLGASTGDEGRPGRIEEVSLAGGDVLVIASEGVVEALDAGRQRFGWTPFGEVLGERAERPLEGAASEVAEACVRWAGEESAIHADRSILLVRRGEST